MELLRVNEEDIDQLPDRKRVQFINSLSGFKSSNLIGTIDNMKNTNLSITSSAFHLGASPPLLGFIIRPDSVPRDTLNNLRETKICTLNHVNQDIIAQAHQTSARYPKELSEFEACGLTEEYLDTFEAPFVEESKIKMALQFIREERLPENGCHFIITQVIDVYIPKKSLRENGSIDINEAQTVCVGGLDTYYKTERLSKFSYAKPGVPLETLDK
jgi:flavin reductase (DIM6/NTAB) family NADH-FMN oxidoreductase RutF